MHDDDDVNQPDSRDGTDASSAPFAAEIASAAEVVDVGDPSAMLVAVRSVSDRRRRRRNVFVGVAAAGMLVASGVVVARLVDGGSGDDLIVSAPDTAVPVSEPADSVPTSADASTADETVSTDPSPAPVTDSVESADSGTESTEVVELPAVDPLPVRLIPSSAEDLGDSVAADSFGENLLFPWKGGFLAIGTTFEPQPLPPELPQEIIDAFPPEVVEFFPDGLPATIEEATQQLQEAGLLDEVSDIIVNNPEVSDAIYSQRVEPQRSVRVSADGVDWTEVEASFPDGANEGLYNAASTGERFAFATMIYDDQLPDGAGGTYAEPTVSAVEVHSTTDLITWTTQSIPLAQPLATDSLVRAQMYLSSFAATDAGYVLSVERSVDVDVFQLLDSELRERANNGGFGVSYGDRGVTVSFDEVLNEAGAVEDGGPDTYTFTWEELGVDSSPAELDTMSSERWVGTWDGGSPVVADAAGDSNWIVAVGDDFVELGPTPRRSPDGLTWEQIDLPDGGFTDMIVETTNGLALRMSDRFGGGTVYTGNLATGEWTPLETPGLPASAQPEGRGSGGFLFARYGDEQFDDPFVDSIGSLSTAEVDGYRYELEMTGDGNDISSTYTVTDVESGAVVATETSDGVTDGSPFEHVDENSEFGGAFTILDPDSGDAIVTIPYQSMRQQIINADGSVTEMVDSGPPETRDWSAPEFWVLAALDDGWTLQQVSDGSDEERYPTGMVAVGNVALVGWPDGSFTRIVPS